ncbi:hypothetical protein [Phenylobacterium sp.]|uniref:hypothetical protein n=1 Tax=Phenylobacterium sp. TaxID=1871053 RepID=UPI0035B449BC
MSATLLLRDQHRTCVFRVRSRGGVWEVTRDHVFHGDYLTRGAALASACSAARSFEAAGGTPRVLLTPQDRLIDHQGLAPRS